MKRYIYTISVLFFMAFMANAQKQNTIAIDSLQIERNDNLISIKFAMDVEAVRVKSNRALLVVPCIVSGADSLELPAWGLYGRKRYIHLLRNGNENISGKDELTFRQSEKNNTYLYEHVIPYEPWMDSCNFVLFSKSCGCCDNVLDSVRDLVYTYLAPVEPFMPTFVYITPLAEPIKTRSITGEAYIDFTVNQTYIDPDYRENRVELAKINATVEPLTADADITVKSLFIKGHASPEASYKHNVRLARERTKSLVEYVKFLYDFGNAKIETDYDPEDWAGLREFVLKTNLENREAILAIIDDNNSYDKKESLIKRQYPKDYKYLYDHCYPALRRSDYKIDYVIRSYTNIDEIMRVMYEAPQKLSLQELYLVSHHFEEGSDEFNETFDIAVRIYPNDEVANLNAANIAMSKHDLKAAARYLAKAGNSKEAIYARCAYAFLEGDYSKAEQLAGEAIKVGVVEEAKQILDEIKRINRKPNEFKKTEITINK